MLAVVTSKLSVDLSNTNGISVNKTSVQNVRQRHKSAMRMGWEPFREKGALQVPKRIPWSKTVTVMDQHDERRRPFVFVKVGTDAPRHFVLELCSSRVSKQFGDRPDEYTIPYGPYRQTTKLLNRLNASSSCRTVAVVDCRSPQRRLASVLILQPSSARRLRRRKWSLLLFGYARIRSILQRL